MYIEKLNGFAENLLKGFDTIPTSKKYMKVKPVNENGDKIIITIGKDHGCVFHTKFGYGLNVSYDKVVWLKDFQVFEVIQGIETENSTIYVHTWTIVLDQKWTKFNPAKQNENYEKSVLLLNTEENTDLWEELKKLALEEETVKLPNMFEVFEVNEPKKLEANENEKIINELTINSIE